MRPARSKSSVRNPGSTPPQAAFSLIEIVLAIGVFVFAIVAILALMSIGSNSNLAAATDTSLAEMTQYVDSYVRHQGFTVLSGSIAIPNGAIPGGLPSSPYLNNAKANFFFDVSGNVITNSSTGIPDTTGTYSTEIYSCTVSASPASFVPALASITGTSLPGTSSNLLYLRYDFRWPVAAHHANPDRTVYSSFANYE